MKVEPTVSVTLTIGVYRVADAPEGMSEAERGEFCRPEIEEMRLRCAQILGELVMAAADRGMLVRGEATIDGAVFSLTEVAP